MKMSDRFDDVIVKSIGDAGDSIPHCLDILETKDSPVCEMVRSIRLALHCGDHQSLKMSLEKLQTWREQKDTESYQDYWRVAQLTGETELKNLSILLTVTSEKPENVRWCYLLDALSVLAMCLCNREIISAMMAYASKILPVLTMAVQQDCDEDVYVQAMTIIRKMLIVCRGQFAKFIISNPLLEELVDKVPYWLEVSFKRAEMLFQVIANLLMCGQDCIHDYAVSLIQKLGEVNLRLHGEPSVAGSDKQRLVNSRPVKLYLDLVQSIDENSTPQECALYLTKGRSRKDLLSLAQGQKFLIINCSWPACKVHNGVSQIFFRKCAACLVCRYCSRQCQTRHWETSHNLHCKLTSLTARRSSKTETSS